MASERKPKAGGAADNATGGADWPQQASPEVIFEPLSPLASEENIRGPMLRAMGRLGAGASVARREIGIERALRRLAEEAPVEWPGRLAALLAEEAGVEASMAHAAVFSGIHDLRGSQIGALARAVISTPQAPRHVSFLRTLLRAAPESRARIVTGKIDSDSLAFRAMLARLFDRSSDDVIEVFMIDAAARLIPKAMKKSLGEIMSGIVERPDEAPAPDGAWGYVVVLREIYGRSGYFVMEPSEAAAASVEALMGHLREHFKSDETAMANALAAAAIASLAPAASGGFSAIMKRALEMIGHRYAIIYVRDDEGGSLTQITPIEASSVEEARRVALKTPELRMHDQIRSMAEFLSRAKEDEDVPRQ